MFVRDERTAASPASPFPGVPGRSGPAPGQARSGPPAVRREAEGRGGPSPAAARAQGPEGERSASPREGRGSGFCFSFHLRRPFPAPSPCPPVCPGPRRLLRRGYQGTDIKRTRFAPFLFWLLCFQGLFDQWTACAASTRGHGAAHERE